MELTDSIIQDALTGKGDRWRGELLDGREAGLRLKVGHEDVRWSVLARLPEGASVRIPIGGWPNIDLTEARIRARQLKRALERPEPEDDADLTVGQLLDVYDKRRLTQLRKGSVVRRALDRAFVDLVGRRARGLGRREISCAVDTIADHAPIHANRMLAYSKAFFGWAVGRGYLDANPALGISKPSREVARERTPTLGELVEIWRAAEGLGYPFGPVVHLLILTAARREEIGGMQLAELNLTLGDGEGCWTLPACRSKNGRAIRVPLAARAVRILETAVAAKRVDGPHVFSTTGLSAVSGWSRAKTRIDGAIAHARAEGGEGAAMEPWRLHDLRRSFATHACDELQIDPAVADRCLNHMGSSTTSTVSRVYARNEMFEQRKVALDRWAALIERSLRSTDQAGRPELGLGDICGAGASRRAEL